ncbi:RING-H2 finger protein ATL78-like isoform X2 [Panicum virgatum]|uniref:RING-type domain-containing protein n=1 Tax=Panicum virgatum TaxID=38727 RepID=A0A8T0WUF3_PANVG|nr:RING-H2 finger protein ATL78-like isoform X2 [Panicum virgatum]KAG2651460.1 hypothetical protein PVAP13_1NG295700 [Panicum virgatum]
MLHMLHVSLFYSLMIAPEDIIYHKSSELQKCLCRQEKRIEFTWEGRVGVRESITSGGEASMQEGYVLSRRALLLRSYGENAAANQVVAGQEAPPAADVAGSAGNSFDANVVMILAVLLCALICALGLNSIVRCALRCSTRMSSAPGGGARRQQAAGGGGPVCAICLGELEPGERVRVLPKCNHGFHVRCVDRWLLARSTRPTCRQSLFAAPPKGSGCADADADAEPPVRAFLVPLRPEGFVTPYDF